ncbi:hypothetical protein PHISCL_08661 [Aspergillus sclerotialis]|uniref:Uncharacterized protein n=1 Tax=Aspergillus sclerotialis TaxID=2070753 RepID=A0A3A2Z7C2_9EURO|nr:hypothetical protein PHISCL_08661 [Aspergillus sclerotialis]
MGGYEWTEEEKAMAVYFTFLGVRYDAIAELLNRRGFTRSEKAVSSIIRSIQKDERIAIRALTRTEADALIDRVARDSKMYGFLLPTDDDQRIVHQGIDIWKEYLEWLDRGNQ